MKNRLVAAVVMMALTTSACASAGGARYSTAPQAPVVEQSTMAEYVARIPAGSRVRVEATNGASFRGTLLKSTAQAVTVQRNTRVPEPPVDIPIGSVARLTLDDARGSSTAKAIGIGVASGVGTFFGILAILAASWD